MRYMVLCVSSKAEGGTGRYEPATRRVFAALVDAEKYRAGISPSRQPVTVAIVRPAEGEDVWFNEHEAEFLFLYETTDPEHGPIVWLLDGDGIDVGIPKANFLAHFHQHKDAQSHADDSD